MKRRTLSIVSLILCMGVLLCTGVMAEGTDAGSYVVTYSAEEITDVEALIQLGLAQHNQARSRSAANGGEDELLTATQVLEVREYADGSKEEDRVTTNLGLTVAQANDEDIVSSQAWNITPGYTILSSFYYTRRYVYPASPNHMFRANRMVTSITKLDSATISILSANQRIILTNSKVLAQAINFDNYKPSGTQTFTLYSSDSNFYTSETDLLMAVLNGVLGESHIKFSNGHTASIQIMTELPY